jgi:undecaprenyl-diphosphatase
VNLLQILLLGLVQGAAELLPVSSSAHVIIAEKLMGLDPSAPDMTFLLVMLHTGTMFAVIVYFWKSWASNYFGSPERLKDTAINIILASVATIIVGLGLQFVIEKIFMHGQEKSKRSSRNFPSLPVRCWRRGFSSSTPARAKRKIPAPVESPA